MNFGYNMQTNINPKYDNGKKILEKYIKEQEEHCAFLRESLDKYLNTPFDLPDFSCIDMREAVVYLRTWKLINELPTNKKNLLLIFCACKYNYKKTLEVFNGVGKGCKNIATLRVLITNIRKLLRQKYDEQYGDNRLDFIVDDSGVYC